MIYLALIITCLSLILALNMFGLTGDIVNRLLDNFKGFNPSPRYWQNRR